jgi:hypothetical protein
MSFFEDASLVLIPSAYKDQKVYSVKPTDGTGDLTFSRASSATRVASNGLIEKVRENLLLQSNSFDTTWTNIESTETSGQAGYDGTNNAWLLDITGGTSSQRIVQTISLSGSLTLSVYAKAGTKNWTRLLCSGTISGNAYFNLQTGALGTATNCTSKIEAAGNGYYRCSISVNTTITDARIYVATDDLDTTQVSGNILIQSAQLEAGDIATDYIATTTTAVSVGPVSGLPRLDYLGSTCPRLLLEPQRTNSVTFSEQLNNAVYGAVNCTVSANNTTSPSGYVDADKIVEDSANTNKHLRFPNSSLTSGTSYIVSFFAKPDNCDVIAIREGVVSGDAITYKFSTNTTSTQGTRFGAIKVEDYANGFKRISVSFLPTTTSSSYQFRPTLLGNAYNQTTNTPAGSYTYLGDGVSGVWAWGAQLEEGAYATSYIPTLGASVTRVADAASKTGANVFFGTNTGTIVINFDSVGFDPSSGNYVFDLAAGVDAANRILVYFSPSDNTLRLFYARTDGTNAQQTFNVTMSAIKKVAVKWTASDIKMFYNGTPSASFAFGATAPNDLTLFARYTDVEHLAARASQVLTFPTALTDAQCIELTTI